MYLLITESPAKAKKIEGFLNENYKVRSSCGHIRDLEKKKTKQYGDPKGFGIDVENDFKPKYVNLSDKRDVIKNLKEASVDREIIFAADDDREGEAIAWHTANVLKANIEHQNRIVFREISKKAILESLEKPRQIDMNEVNSQQARRIIDRLIGFKLSPCLWKNIQTTVKGLSAGRVQSALLNLVEERDQYIKNYKPEIISSISGDFRGFDGNGLFTKKDDIETDDLFEIFANDRTFISSNIEEEPLKNYPDKPFITSSLQQTAQKNFGFPIKHTMNLAQKLYDSGHITYMRTDSTFISKEFQDKIKNMINVNFKGGYYNKPNTKKVKGAQEAHEAIRMTSLKKPDINGDELKLYNMIYDRTITSHMKPSEYINHKVKLNTELCDKYGYFTITHKQLIFPGYKIYSDKTLKKEDKPQFQKQYHLQESVSSEKEGNTPQYYDESAVVNLLEKTGIGRPSTYSTIVGTLDNRNYTVKQDIIEEDKMAKLITLTNDDEIIEEEKKIKGRVQKKRIVITPLGVKVLEYLRENFMNIIQKDFTCEVEKDLDLIATGERDHVEIIRKVYDSFIDIVERQLSSINKARIDLKFLGNKDKKEIFIGDGKYGPYLQIKDKKVKNMNITKYLELIQKSIQEVTIDDALKYLEYPKKINDNIYIHIGPYGYYMKYNGVIYNIQQRKDGEYSEEYCLSLV